MGHSGAVTVSAVDARVTSHGDLLRAVVLIVLALGQVVSSAVVFGGGLGNLSSDGSDPMITPAAYAFVIWTVPIVSCLVYAGVAWRHRGEASYRAVGWPLAATMAGFSLWLGCAAAGWVRGTVLVFAAMLAGLAVAVRAAARSTPPSTRAERGLLRVTLGVYAGWTTVAVWANLAAALHANGAGLPDTPGWQLAVLAAAALSAVLGVWWTRADAAYTVTVLWALTAVVVATFSRGAATLGAAAGLACALVVIAAVLVRVTATNRRGAAAA